MTQTWMATFEVDRTSLRALVPLVASTKENFEADISDVFVVEVFRFEDETGSGSDRGYFVLLSTGDSSADPKVLRCRMAFGNDVSLCDEYRGRGFPVSEADITLESGTLHVRTSYYAGGDSLAMQVGDFLQIEGVEFALSGKPTQTSPIQYDQVRARPNLRRPGFDIIGLPRNSSEVRQLEFPDGKAVNINFKSVLFPNFHSLWPESAASKSPRTLLRGYVDKEISPKSPSPPVPLRKAGSIGDPDYLFEDMELFGFRIDVPPPQPRQGDPLETLIAPLNFHLRSQKDPWKSVKDFQYRVAARSIIIELIRYGKMKYRKGSQPMGPDHYMSQHELLVRVLVGRVDQGGSEARDPATYVTSIFVDNPVSKSVGRELQGYPKQLATFCRRVDGRLERVDSAGKVGGVVVPLEKISTVCLTTDLRRKPGLEEALLEISYSSPGFLEEDLQSLDASTDAGASELAGLPWRQGDFTSAEFQRTFARDVIGERFQRSRSVQVVPLDTGNEPQTWLTGTFALNRIRFQRPSGIATLTFHRDHDASSGWYMLSDILGNLNGTASVSLPSGDWYRVKCNMDLTIDDGLQW